jgi:hypothetical protein
LKTFAHAGPDSGRPANSGADIHSPTAAEPGDPVVGAGEEGIFVGEEIFSPPHATWSAIEMVTHNDARIPLGILIGVTPR